MRWQLLLLLLLLLLFQVWLWSTVRKRPLNHLGNARLLTNKGHESNNEKLERLHHKRRSVQADNASGRA